MANVTDSDVIILYETKHKDMVKRIKSFLEQSGIKVWFDENNAGIEIFVAMAQAIQKSRVVLACISRFYQSSRSSVMELKHAQDCGKRVILLTMDRHEPEGTLKALTAGKVNFKFYEDIGERDFFLAITRLTNTVQAILNEGPDISVLQATMDDMPTNVHSFTTHGNSSFGCTYENSAVQTFSTGEPVSTTAVYANESMNTVPPNPNELLEIMFETMGKPLKELPGLTTLSRLMDPIIVVDRVMELGNFYKLSVSDLQYISGAVCGGGHNPALTFLNFLQSMNHNMLISELRECLSTRKEEFGRAFLAINRYTNNRIIGDITASDIDNLAVALTILPAEPHADWEYVADYFGYGMQIGELKYPKVNVNLTSRFESLCGIISGKFPDHTIRQFVENCKQLQFNDVVKLVENNIKQHAERTLKNRERRRTPDRFHR